MVRQRVLNPWRDFRENRARQHGLFLELSQVASQHVLAYPRDRAAQLVEAHRSSEQLPQDKDLPSSSENRKRGRNFWRRTRQSGRLWAGFVNSQLFHTIEDNSSYL